MKTKHQRIADSNRRASAARRGRPEPHDHQYTRRWMASLVADFERIEHGGDPAIDRLYQRLRATEAE